MWRFFFIFLFLSGSFSQDFEWTALGDSYASGVGSGNYVDGRRCLRYDQAYPVFLNEDPNLSPLNHIFNNVVCSGSTTEEVELYQFYDDDTSNQPNWQFAPRPKFGNPQMATLSIGGNDIDFKGILFNCIIESTQFGYKPTKPCDQQRQETHALIDSPDLVNNIDHLIKKTVTKGRSGTIGDAFRLYVTGFPEFFNENDPGCDTVTFARTANPVPDGNEHIMMTTDLRKDYNSMSRALNTAIQSAVSLNADSNVKFIDIQANGLLDGHRFCEPNIKEPDQNNENLWLFHYPYKQNEDQNPSPELQIMINATDQITNGLDISALGVKFPNISVFEDALWDAVNVTEVAAVSSDPVDDKWYDLWRDTVGWRAKLFHPQVAYHSAIRELVLNQFLEDTRPATKGNGTCVPVGSTFDPQMLRILSLGGSITWGQQSPSGNGYRKYLRDKLISNGANVNMVGTIKHGTMGDNDNEGWPGFRVDQISDRANNDLPLLPNLVLINAGTNDVAQDYDIDTIDQRLEDLVNKLLDAIPGTVVIVSTLLVNRNATKESITQGVNSKYVNMVEKMADAGKFVYLADMSSITTEMINARDGTHPTDYGYEVMAGLWYSAIQEVYANCWLTAPAAVAGLNDSDTQGGITTCEANSANFPAPTQIQKGSGYNDSNYHHVGHPYGVDDFIYNSGEGVLGIVINDGTGKAGLWTYNEYALNISMGLCPDMRFGDLNGDGLADCFCVGSDGTLSAYLNDGGGSFPTEPIWTALGVIMSAQGYSNDMVRLADIDGDGRVDYLGIDADGNVRGWRNVGTEKTGSPSWVDMGIINSGGTMGDVNGIRFVDINGDGRADWAWVSNTGQIYTSINQRGSDLSYHPVWLPTLLTHQGTGQGGPNVTDRSHVLLGNVINKTFTADTNFPKYDAQGVDYTTIFESEDKLSLHAHVLGNSGIGGARTKGDGVHYCDMRGSGTDDLVWIGKTGNLTLHANNHMLPAWGQYQHIFIATESLMSGHVRKDIHLADLDGDGKCDFLLVDKESNSIHMLRNDYSRETDTFSFTDVGTVSGGVNCQEHYGPGLFDLASSSAVYRSTIDLELISMVGDGKADFLCIGQDGTVNGWLNKGLNNFQSAGIIKTTEGKERANLRFADINGDGRADLLALDPVSGAAAAWTNGGSGGNSGETFNWQSQGTVFPGGYMRGECIHFANINGYGRADYVYIEPNLARGDVIYNVCA
ncbi:SGNH hydrolase-type esterase domain-containing protein [Talaromyces proteolyticus]|uniref:SGNH hydrolase-type esterase domain-containing protein n=1 Tax=Talaromyces proteolyticus TaxID=1131652 RepID=A0AAD4KD44_9EURO|nr:SGNH hydrolase-type esterase domain-containing protein [Talaromyces proteolyticus]KAH8688824.1 SGNH hydrolase-type esterase domain-containing protein [Talaromyces proteolyticus]